MGVGEEALGRLERLPGGAGTPQLVDDADPAGAVASEGLELGKGCPARVEARDGALVEACPLGEPGALHEP